MEQRQLGTRYLKEDDIRKRGVLWTSLPKPILESNNKFVKFFVKSIDVVLIYLIRYIDKLKNFKNYNKS